MYVDLKNKLTNKSKLVGYCKLHKGYMTTKQLKTKKCLTKTCFHLVRLDHPYWKQREAIKRKKKLKKKGAKK